MARRYSTVAEVHSGTDHIECPRCGRRSIVEHGEGRFSCVRCGWSRNVADGSEPIPIYVLIAIITIAIIVTIG